MNRSTAVGEQIEKGRWVSTGRAFDELLALTGGIAILASRSPC